MPSKIVARSAIGLPGPKRARSPMERPLGFALHYSASLADVRALHSECPGIFFNWYRWHTRPGGLGVPEGGADIAYNWAICPHGYRYILRGRRYQSGANGSSYGNRNFYAVCVMGTDRENLRDLTPLARDALFGLVHHVSREKPTIAVVRPHSDFRSTSCPGDELRALIPELNHVIAKIRQQRKLRGGE